MNPTHTLCRAVLWLLSTMLCLLLMSVNGPAQAQTLTLERSDGLREILRLEVEPVEPEGPVLERDPAPNELHFTKTGRQLDCDFVEYKIRFELNRSADYFADPAQIAKFKNIRIDVSDQLPAGLSAVSASVSGDITDAVGGAIADASIGTTVNPNDTVELNDVRFSLEDLDGDGLAESRSFEMIILAKIDQAAFPAPAMVDNQAVMTITLAGPSFSINSHDPAVPDDGDPATGEATSVLIDVTDCDTPPGGGTPEGEACFVVEEGEVDCAPGDGTYIFKMPVGPEMAGREIELVPNTPGVTVNPPSQIVPAGGGVLVWTIDGALPGMTINLSAVGIEHYVGPAEGWGLCCTQEIEIIIPEDLDCPEDDKEPDLKVEKRAVVPECEIDGGCKFTIRVTNVGDAAYNGKIVLDEVTTPGNATIDGGPNAPWVCVPGTTPMSCEHPATTLNPGEFVELNLSFDPGPGWVWNHIRNCAEYDYTASGKAPFGDLTNDKACAEIPICIPGTPGCDDPDDTPRKVDLELKKDATEAACSADGVCNFVIRITNLGPDNHNGPMTVVDTYPTGAPISSVFGPAPWACGPIGADTFKCDHAGINLPAGAFTLITVQTVVDVDTYPGNVVENCARVDQVADETNLINNRDCARAIIPGKPDGNPDLSIDKICRSGAVGAAVSCRISVSNLGTAAPVGTIEINDAAVDLTGGGAVPVSTVTPDGPEWSCSAVPAPTLTCSIPGSELVPGSTRHFDVTLQVTPNQRFENCAEGVNVIEGEHTTTEPVGRACDQGGVDISVTKTGDAECEQGGECRFEITISNDGSSAFNGPVLIADAMSIPGGGGALPAMPITSINPPLGCTPEPASLPFACEANVSLAPGASQTHEIVVSIPADGPVADTLGGLNENQFRNCVLVADPSIAGAGRTAPSKLLGQGNADGAAGPKGQPYACFDFAINAIEEEESCSPGFVLNDNGRCVCPAGTKFRNGKCVGDATKPEPPATTVPVPEPRPECKLLPGQIRTQSGKCVCPRGTRLVRGACRKVVTPPAQCKLLPGQIRTQSGKCVCPRGTRLVRGACRKVVTPPAQCKLLPGQIRTQSGKCVCPRGTRLVRGACRKVVTPPAQCKLLPGQIRTQSGKCVCPRGTRLVRGACRKVVTPPAQCKLLPGQIRTQSGKCVCPRGTKLIRGACRKQTTTPQCKLLPGQIRTKDGRCVCPRGTRWNGQRCEKPRVQQPIKCKRGYVNVGGKCVRLQINRPQTNVPLKQIKPLKPLQRSCPKGTYLSGGKCVQLR